MVKLNLDWKINILAILLLPCLISLGFWQLDRAEQKRQLQSSFTRLMASEPLDFMILKNTTPINYQPVSLTGHYDSRYTLYLDNKIQQGEYGVEVLSAFKIKETNDWVWINRGWQKADPSRRSLPTVPKLSEQTTQINAMLYKPEKSLLLLEKPIAKKLIKNIPILLPEFNSSYLTTLPINFYPHSFRLAENQYGSLTNNWKLINQSPDKHHGYAVQWFAMAVALMMIVLLANTNLWHLIKQKKSQST